MFQCREANQSQFSRRETPLISSETQTKIKKMKSKANFKTAEKNLTHEMKGSYTNLHPQTNNKSKPNAKPIQTQFTNAHTTRFPITERGSFT